MSAWMILITKMGWYGGAVRLVEAMLRAVRFASNWCVVAKLQGRNPVGGVLMSRN